MLMSKTTEGSPLFTKIKRTSVIFIIVLLYFQPSSNFHLIIFVYELNPNGYYTFQDTEA